GSFFVQLSHRKSTPRFATHTVSTLKSKASFRKATPCYLISGRPTPARRSARHHHNSARWVLDSARSKGSGQSPGSERTYPERERAKQPRPIGGQRGREDHSAPGEWSHGR